MTEEEMVGWNNRLDRHEFGQAPGVGDGQGSLASAQFSISTHLPLSNFTALPALN